MAKISEDLKKEILDACSNNRDIKQALEHDDKVPALVFIDSKFNAINLDIVKKRRRFQEDREALSKLEERAENLSKLRKKLI